VPPKKKKKAQLGSWLTALGKAEAPELRGRTWPVAPAPALCWPLRAGKGAEEPQPSWVGTVSALL
jgi:hypothetical protein